MVGITVQREPEEGIIIYKNGQKVFLDKWEATHLAEAVKEARRCYWKRFRLESMTEYKIQ